MKIIFALSFLSLVALTIAGVDRSDAPYPRECLYIHGTCVAECPVGTHSYTADCGPMMPEATCDQPNPVLEKDEVCDFSDCYCNPPTVRDTINNRCVQLTDCPKKNES